MAQQVNQDLVQQYKQQFKADIDQHRNWSEDLDTDPIEKLTKTQYMINGNNLKELKKLIQNFQPNAPAQLDYEESGKNQIVQTSPIVSIGMRFLQL